MKISIAIAFSSIVLKEIIHYIWFITSSRSRYWDPKEAKNTIYLSWKELKDYYWVNPKKWFYSCNGYGQDMRHIYYQVKKDDYYLVVTVSPLSYWRVRWYYFIRHKKDNRVKEILLENVQEDVNHLKEKAQGQIDQANKILEEMAKK